MTNEESKYQRLLKFMQEHPQWYKNNFSKFSTRQEKIAKKLQMWEEVLAMRYKNKMTLEAIGKKYKLTRQRVEQIIKNLKLEE